jgi:hypothetical protein
MAIGSALPKMGSILTGKASSIDSRQRAGKRHLHLFKSRRMRS